MQDTTKYSILVAEDHESNYNLLHAILHNDFNIIWAKTGEDVLNLLKTESPDMILMDIKMPVMDGLEATRKIREVKNEIPIIALTAYAFQQDKVEALKNGCNDYLSKPVTPSLLLETIQKYLPKR